MKLVAVLAGDDWSQIATSLPKLLLHRCGPFPDFADLSALVLGPPKYTIPRPFLFFGDVFLQWDDWQACQRGAF